MKKTKMLKKNYEFKKVLSKGKFYNGKEIEIVILKNNLKINLLGIAVSTKNGKAFQRNKAKRIIRESYGRLENKLLEGNSIIILLRKDFQIRNICFNNIYEEMKSIFDKAEILEKEEKI